MPDLSDQLLDDQSPDDEPLAGQSDTSSTEPLKGQLKEDSTSLGNSLNADVKPAYATANANLSKRPTSIANGSRAFMWYLLSLIVLGVDQWTKWLAETKLAKFESIPVIEPYLSWTLAYNKGAAFSLLANQPGWQKWFFVGIALVMTIFLIVYLIRAPRQAKWLNTGLALILSGAIGNNLIDRVRIGKVVDFIHVHYADVWHYPIFNVADMAICIGVALVVIDMLFLENKRNKT